MNEKQLLDLLANAKSQEEYDHLIDLHLFKITKKNRNTKHNRSFHMLTSDQMTLIKRKEISTDPDLL